MTKMLVVAVVVLFAAVLLVGCCGIPFPGGNEHATITGMTGRDGAAVANGGSTTQRVQHISGTVDNPSGTSANTFGGKVAIVLNGDKQYVTPTSKNEDGTWDFGGDFVIRRGSNNVVVQVEDSSGSVYGQSAPFTVTGNLPTRQVESVLTWNTDDNDVDMHIYAPGGQHTYYSSLNAISGCNLDLDDTDGYGPETFVCENTTQTGQWTIKVRYYAEHGVTGPVTATVRVTLNEGQTQTYTHSFTADQANADNPDNDWTVTTFTR